MSSYPYIALHIFLFFSAPADRSHADSQTVETGEMEPPPCSPLTDPSSRQDRDDEESVASTPVFDPDETVNSQVTAATDVTQPHAQLLPQRRINVSQVRPFQSCPTFSSPTKVVRADFHADTVNCCSTPKHSASACSSRSTKSARTKSMCHSPVYACPPPFPHPVNTQPPPTT